MIRILGCLLLLAAQGAVAQPLAYYSDYFSFIGEDAQGKVAFALDTNRGQDGGEFQAEHFTVLHDERRGWIALQGNGAYANPGGMLAEIPSSQHFAFAGSAEKGLVVRSESNGLALEIAPLPRLVERAKDGAVFRLGSAPATLRWDGRVLPGRVIHEYLHRPGWNRLTRTYFGQWRDFHGLYLRIEGGGDLYLHRSDLADEDSVTGALVGFAVLDGRAGEMREVAVEIPHRAQALGLYRWPAAWRGAFRLDGVAYRFELTLAHRKVVANWLIGGFAMGIASGELRRDGEQRRLYGLAELIL